MHYAVQTSNLSKIFTLPLKPRDFFSKDKAHESTVALDSVSLGIEKGRVFGLLGLNGAGKTTLIKVLSALVLPTSGQAWINGYDVVRDEARVRASVGLATGDERSFYWRLTGRQNLEFFASLYNLQSSQAKKRISELSEELGLNKYVDQRFYTYSAGIKQRMAIARALLRNPPVLFLDEPTKNLDPRSTRDVRQIIKQKIVEEQGATVVFATHRLDEAEDLCDSLAILEQGRVQFCGTVDKLKELLKLPVTYSMRVTNFNYQSIASLKQLVNISLNGSKTPVEEMCLEFESTRQGKELSIVSRHIVQSGGTILTCDKHDSTLEKMFLHLATADPPDHADKKKAFEKD